MRHGALFNGISGFCLAAEWMGWENIFSSEINEFCNDISKKHFPNCEQVGDIFKFNGSKYANSIDILTGGFPCQSFSVAGKGATDITLWKEMYRVINECKPTYVVAENVPGIVSRKRGLAFNIVCADLENSGYTVTPLNLPVAGCGAPHERERVWFVGYSDTLRKLQQERGERNIGRRISDSDSNIAHSESSKQKSSGDSRTKGNGFADGNTCASDTLRQRCEKHHSPISIKEEPTSRSAWESNWHEVAARLCRVDDGLPSQLDTKQRTQIYKAVKHFGRKETERITGIDCSKVNPFRAEAIMSLGNAIAPVVAYEIFKAIESCYPPMCK